MPRIVYSYVYLFEFHCRLHTYVSSRAKRGRKKNATDIYSYKNMIKSTSSIAYNYSKLSLVQKKKKKKNLLQPIILILNYKYTRGTFALLTYPLTQQNDSSSLN